MATASSELVEFLSVLPASHPRIHEYQLDKAVKPKTLGISVLINYLVALIGPLTRHIQAEQAGNADVHELLAALTSPQTLRKAHDGAFLTAAQVSVQQLLLAMTQPTLVPATDEARVLVHPLKLEAVYLNNLWGPRHGVLGRVATALRMGLAGAQQCVLGLTSNVAIHAASRFVVAINALLARKHDIELMESVVKYNQLLKAARPAAIAAIDANAALTDKQRAAQKAALPEPLRVRSYVQKRSPFSEEHYGDAQDAELDVKQRLVVDGAPRTSNEVVPHPSLHVNAYVNTLKEVSWTEAGSVLWHYVLVPALGCLADNLRGVGKVAVGTAFGTLLLPGTGTTIGFSIAEMA